MLTRRALALTTLALPALGARTARAETAPLRIIVPAPPGGPTDMLARALGEHAQNQLGRAVVVENKAGAGGVIGTEAAARAAPDGDTIVLGHNQTHAGNQALMPKLPYHVIESFAPVAKLATVHHALVVPETSPAKTLAELIARGKREHLSFASSQAGSASHVIGATFVKREGLDATHIPYRGAAPAATDTVAGIVDFYVATFPSVSGLVRDGRLRVLEIGAPARLPDFAEIPTAAEAGAPYLAVDAWFGLFAPAGTAPEKVAAISAAMRSGLADPTIAGRLEKAGFTPDPLPPAEFARFQAAEVERWKEMIALTGVTIDG